MDNDLKAAEDVVVDSGTAVTQIMSNEVAVESNIESEDVFMKFDSNENQSEDQINFSPNQEILDTNDVECDSGNNCLPIEEITSTLNQEEDEVKSGHQLEDILGHEEVLANDVMNLDVNEEVVAKEDNEETDEAIESQNCEIDSQRLSLEEDMTLDNPVIRNESTSDSPKAELIGEVGDESNGQTVLNSVDEAMSDSDLRIAGLKTSLMLSEEKLQRIEKEKQELEEELKKVYTHLFKSLDEKKNLQKKCDTLEEQMEKLMSTSAQKRPAQESPGATAKPTPPKKTSNIRLNNEQNNNSKNKKSVRFQAEQRPYFGRFGARYRAQETDMTPPPFPGRFAAAFQPPPMVMASRSPMAPMGAFRGPPVMASPEMTDIALNDGFQLISNIGNRLHLTATIVDRAIRLFRQCYESPLRAMCRTQNQSTATACVYIACREEHCPQTFKTLCSVSKIDFKVMSQCCKYIVNAFGLCLDQMTTDEAIVEFCARSGLSPHIQRAANIIAQKALQSNILSVKSPLTAAAAAIFMASMASEEQRPVFEIAQLTGVGDSTIRNAYNRMLSYARQLFPPNFPFYTPPEHLPRV